MGWMDDVAKAFDVGAGLIKGELNKEENTCAQVSLTCPCGFEQTFAVTKTTPEEMVGAIKDHVQTCSKAKGGGA